MKKDKIRKKKEISGRTCLLRAKRHLEASFKSPTDADKFDNLSMLCFYLSEYCKKKGNKRYIKPFKGLYETYEKLYDIEIQKFIKKDLKKGILKKCKKCGIIYLNKFDEDECPHNSK